MVLTDREIEAALSSQQILVEPRPVADAFSSSSLDLTFDATVYRWKLPRSAGVDQTIDPSLPGYSYVETARELTDKQEIGAEGLLLGPSDFILGFTRETLSLPPSSRLAARVEGKSSLARLGVAVHVTAPTIHAGFHGAIQLEICNQGPLRVRLRPGMRICQLIFEQTLGTPNKGYTGQFLGQSQ